MRRHRDTMTSPLPLALAHLAGACTVAVALAAVLVQAGPLGAVPLAYSYPALAACYAAAGLLAWWRRPANRFGSLLVLGGGAWLVAGLQNTGIPVLIGVGTVTSSLPLSVLVHLLHAVPGGRLRGRVSRVTVALVYVVGLVLQVPLWAFTPQEPPFDVVLVSPRPELAQAALQVQRVCGAALVVVTVWLLVRRLREYDRGQRRVLAPLFGYGVLAVLAIPVGSALLRPLLGVERAVAVQLVALAGVPVGFAGVVLRGGFARTGELSALASSAAGSSTRHDLEEAVARTLGDPSAALLQWSPDRGAYVDAAGTVTPPPEEGEQRATVHVLVGDRRLGAVVYDPRLNADPSVVSAVGRVVAIAMDRERLAEEVSQSQQALREASSRLLSESDRVRRRLARDLHDGLQVCLVRLSMQAHRIAQDPVHEGAPELAVRLAADVDDAATALRDLVHGVMPAPLVERGLAAAVQELVYDLPVRARLQVDGVPTRLPPAVESTAYFVVAEGLTNVLKHAQARQVELSLRLTDGVLAVEVGDDGRGGVRTDGSGSGLPGLRDRLEVLGGRLTVTSDSTGTRLRAAMPCG